MQFSAPLKLWTHDTSGVREIVDELSLGSGNSPPKYWVSESQSNSRFEKALAILTPTDPTAYFVHMKLDHAPTLKHNLILDSTSKPRVVRVECQSKI